MNNLEVNQVKKLLLASILLIIGILFCCSLAMGINGLSIIIGFLLLLLGIIFEINAIIIQNNYFSRDGFLGVIIISISLLFIINKIAGLIFLFIPWFLLIWGILLIVDTLLEKFYRKQNNINQFIIKIAFASISIILGICLKVIDGFTEYASVMLGILMITCSVYLIFITFFNKKSL